MDLFTGFWFINLINLDKYTTSKNKEVPKLKNTFSKYISIRVRIIVNLLYISNICQNKSQ